MKIPEIVIETGFIVGIVIVTVVVIFILVAFPTMWLWNWLMPEIFGLTTISWLQALGLLALSNLLFKSSSITTKRK